MRLRQTNPDKRKPPVIAKPSKPSYADLDLQTGRNRASGYHSPIPRGFHNPHPLPTTYDLPTATGAEYNDPNSFTIQRPACRQTLIPFHVTPLFRNNGRLGLRLNVGVSVGTPRDPRGGYPNLGGS